MLMLTAPHDVMNHKNGMCFQMTRTEALLHTQFELLHPLQAIPARVITGHSTQASSFSWGAQDLEVTCP
jgi:hypothetical protein